MDYNNFAIPTTLDEEFSYEDIAEDMAGLRLSFQRIKIPAGGGLQFEIPGGDPENPDYTRALEGVILFNHAANAYWPDGGYDEDENGPPMCSSADGITGIGDPGGACAICPLNTFGSGENGRGKACKNMRHLYLLRDGAYMPVLVTLSPTSLKPFNDFVGAIFAARRRGTCGSIVQIGLKRVSNGNDYSVATFKKLHDFTGEQLSQIKAYADGFRSQVKAMLLQRAADAEYRSDSLMEIDENNYTGANGSKDNSFSVSSGGVDIDGDRDDLPF
jgi:hypothetical protein